MKGIWKRAAASLLAASLLCGVWADVYKRQKYTRLHNNSNILCLGGRVIGIGTALELVDLFLDTPFEGGRHQRRVDMITALEEKK